MKLKLGVTAAGGVNHDIALSCDVTTTVGDAAHALIRSGIFAGSNLEEFVALCRGHVTLLGDPGGGCGQRLLDPQAPLGACGLRSGWQVTVVPEFSSHAERPIPMLGTVEVLSGPQEGAIFSLVAGANTIGRDPQSRIMLDDRSVSRRHAVIELGGRMVLRDLESANGIEVFGNRFDTVPIERTTEVRLGAVALRITPIATTTRATSASSRELDHRHPHTRAPRVDARFPVTKRELPQPPQPVTPGRIPLLAMLAPTLLGGVLFAATRSPMGLMMVAFTPLMMIGSWLDNLASGKRRLAREARVFAESLAREREELQGLRAEEISTRSAETPSLPEIAEAMQNRGRMLWARRPEHASFLEVRFGDGTLRSRTELVLPNRGETAAPLWAELRSVESEFRDVGPVPVLERLGRCGSIGVAGDTVFAAGLARSLVLQLAGLHSPAELVIAAFAGSEREGGEWEWLKWLPHVDPVSSPVAAWQLADTPQAATRLLIALEALIEQRQGGASTVRSHLGIGHAAQHADAAVDRLPPTPAVAVLVLEGEVDEAHRSRLIAVAEEGPDVGVHVIWVARDIARVPAACRSFVELGGAASGEPQGRVGFVRHGSVVPLTRVEHIEAAHAAMLARSLAPVDDTAARALDESDLPRNVHLRELHRVDLLGGGAPILQNWHANGSIVGTWRRGEDREPIRLTALIGQGTDGAAEIDLRLHGPHALVGGTTGAGKSEFLQSWIMSLAANLSPDRLTFLLVDYKGGAAFAECVELPHTVGLVTDLSPHLVRRALTSLRAELRYREELLTVHGAKDLITMERRGDAAAPPVLVIVIDEFAALASEVPEFVEGVIDVAQRGRSLGLHLIMATQRPAGVINDDLRANTNLRIALRMAGEADSADVIGVKDAAFFDAETPGRGALKTSAARMLHFQTGYLGGRASEEAVVSRLEVRSLGFAEGGAWDIPDGARRDTEACGEKPRAARDIERLRDGLIAAAEQGGLAVPRKPWLDMLPALLTLERAKALRAPHLGAQDTALSAGGVRIGVRDRPDAQRQEAVDLDLDEVGNAAIFGASGTGKTSALLTIAASISEHAETDPVHLYAIDAAGGALDALHALPTVGAVASLNDDELMRRVLRHVQGVVADRGSRFAAARANSLGAYRRASRGDEPRVVLLIDGFAAFRQSTETLGALDSPMQMLAEIMQAGRAVGVHVALTADSVGVLPSMLAASVQRQIVLRLASAHDYAYVDVPGDTLEAAPPGRAVFAGQRDEVQLALLGDAPGLASQAQALEALGARLRGQQLVPAVEICNAPERISLHELPVEAAGRPVLGIETQNFTPIGMPVAGLGVIAGPAGSGLSSAALNCADACARWARRRGESVERVLLSFVPQHADGLAGRADWDRAAIGAEAVAELARELTLALGGRPPAAPGALQYGLIGSPLGTVTPLGDTAQPAAPESGDHAPSFPLRAERGIIVVERPTEAEGAETLATLVALAKAARRADALVLFEFEQGAAAGVWDLLSALKQARWGIALQPDETDSASPFGEHFGRVRRSAFPPGRGFIVEAGRITPVQLALPSL